MPWSEMSVFVVNAYVMMNVSTSSHHGDWTGMSDALNENLRRLSARTVSRDLFQSTTAPSKRVALQSERVDHRAKEPQSSASSPRKGVSSQGEQREARVAVLV